MKKIFITSTLLLLHLYYIQAQEIVAIEYIINEPAAFGEGTAITVESASDGTFDFAVNTSELVPGYHTLYFRVRDDEGNWSHTSNRTIEVLEDIIPNMVEAVEFFNNELDDFGTGYHKLIETPDVDGDFVINIPYDEVYPGPVDLFMRVIDGKSQWSFPTSLAFTIIKQDDPPSSIKETNEMLCKIYPNPTSKELFIDLGKQPNGMVQISLWDMLGREIQQYESFDQKTTINFDLEAGIYFLKVHYGSYELVQKISVIN